MIAYNHLRPGVFVYLDGDFAEISLVSKTQLALKTKKDIGMEHLRKIGAPDVNGIRITKELLSDKLHLVEHRGPNYIKEKSDEYTDGRIILRVNKDEDSGMTYAAVFQPNIFPWAEPMGIHMDYITNIEFVHELQNIYLDLFKVEMDVNL